MWYDELNTAPVGGAVLTASVVIQSQSCSAVRAVSTEFGLPLGNMEFKTKTEE